MRALWRCAWLLSLLALAACSTTYRRPGCAAFCAGCCDEADVCRPGSLHDACGTLGSSCVSCTAQQACAQGICGLDVFGAGGGGGSPSDAGTGGGGAAGPLRGAPLRPEVILLLDTSGSLLDPLDGGGTRWALVSDALQALLDSEAGEARFGLVHFPTDSLCASPTSWLVELPTGSDDAAALLSWTDSVKRSLSALTPLGGTPTAGAVNFVAHGAPPVGANRQRQVVLVTDGQPNCNALNPINACDGGSCTCLASSCAGALCALGCLDESSAFGAISGLLASGVTTTVVGVGPDVVSSSALAAMASAGGAQASCPRGTAAECGGDSACFSSSCRVPYLLYASPSGVAATNTVLSQRLRRSGRCRWLLDQPVSLARLQVTIDGRPVSPASWALSEQVVTLLGEACTAVLGDPMPAVGFSGD